MNPVSADRLRTTVSDPLHRTTFHAPDLKEDAMSTTAVAEPTALKTLDRCDRCGAQAYVRAVLAAGGELLFCAHHARAVEDALRPQTTLWQDESDQLRSQQ